MTTWDTLGMAFCGLASIALFAAHVFTSPSKTGWITLPEYVRWGFVLAGATLALRSVDFTNLDPLPGAGHLNAWGAVTAGCVAYALGAFAIWIVATALRNQGWARINAVLRHERSHPQDVPVMMPLDDVAAMARAKGMAAVGPNAAPAEFREAVRQSRRDPAA